MKNKEVIIFLVIALMISAPMAYADNFLSGYSVFDKVGDFFGNAFDTIKNIFVKKEVGIESTIFNLCNENELRCGNENECNSNPCIMFCQNQQWIEWEYCAYQCNNGKCINSQEQVNFSEREPLERNLNNDQPPIVTTTSSEEGSNQDNSQTQSNLEDNIENTPTEEFTILDIDNRPPAPTNLRYEITENNHIILTWDNVLLREGETPGGTGAAITSYAIYNKEILNKITNFIKNLFGKKTVGTEPNKEYSISVVHRNNRAQIIKDDYNYQECDETCTYRYDSPQEGDIYIIRSRIGDTESERYAATEPIQIPQDTNETDIPREPSFYYTLTMNINPQNSGKITLITNEESRDIISLTSLRYPQNKEITLWAYNNDGYSFSGWEDDTSRTDTEITITMNSNKEITANFELERILRPTNSCENLGERQTVSCTTNLYGICNEGSQIRECQENERAQKVWVNITQCTPNVQPGARQEICSNNLDDDCDNQIDLLDSNCHENTYENGCTDSIDNDNDGLINNLDPDCSDQERTNGLKIKAIKTSAKEVYSNSNIIVEGYYEILSRTSNEISQCVNLTLNNIDMNCQQKSPQQGFIRYTGCNIGDEGQNKKINISVAPKCNYHKDFISNTTYINVTEFTTCEEGQVSAELIQLDIIKPDNNKEFRQGEIMPIEARVKNNNDNEIEITLTASILDLSLEEIESTDSEIKTINPLDEKTLKFNMTVPSDLEEGSYKLYVKAYEYENEEGLCKSSSIGIRVNKIISRTECRRNQDCQRGFICEDNECTALSCNLPLILSPDGHSCITRSQEGLGDDGQDLDRNRGETSNIDSDDDGLPDYWEYNYFNNLEQGPDDDPDNDGVSNLDEYRFNTNPKIPDKSKSIFGTLITIIILIILITAVAVFIVKKLKNKRSLSYPKAVNYSMDQENQNKLKAYMQNAKDSGMKKQDIKNALINAGWKERDIDKFL